MSQSSIKTEQRQTRRISMRLSARVEVRVGRTVSWSEEAPCSDVSEYGAALSLRRPLKRGRVVLLSFQMPVHLRRYDARKPEYNVWGVVRHCLQTQGEKVLPYYSTGIAFIGKNEPSGFSEHPSRLYEVAPPRTAANDFWQLVDIETLNKGSHGRRERRKESRFSVPEPLVLEFMDEKGDVIAIEPTVTENISVGGAVIFTQFYAEVGSFLRVVSQQHKIEIISVVRGRRDCSDGHSRLRIEFIDQLFPLEGIC